MTTRRQFLGSIPVAGRRFCRGERPATLTASTFARAEEAAASGPLWRSPSLVERTVTGPNGAITSRDISEVNDRLAMTEKRAIEVAPDVWLLAGWASPIPWRSVQRKAGSSSIRGDSTRAAKEMREKLEAVVGGRVRVAAILLTHWHYADGTAAWADDGAELSGGHEWLDRNRALARRGPVGRLLSGARDLTVRRVPSGRGPDAFPNNLRFLPEKLLAESSYRPPARLFTMARWKPSPSPVRRSRSCPTGRTAPTAWASIFPASGSSYPTLWCRASSSTSIACAVVRSATPNPGSWTSGAWSPTTPLCSTCMLRRLQAKQPCATRSTVQADQVRLIRDQSLRMIARGMDGRTAAEAVFMPPALRKGWEIYGQVESHVRQIYNGTVGWFGNDVYDINPLPIVEEPAAPSHSWAGPLRFVRRQPRPAAAGDIAGWQWALKLTSLLLQRDEQDADARKTRAIAARALGQRTTSSNARGWYITEALEIEGQLLAKGKPVTIAQSGPSSARRDRKSWLPPARRQTSPSSGAD